MVKGSLFFKPSDPKLAKIITIKSPEGFRQSIRTLKRGGITTKEKRALVLAKNRVKVQLKRKKLSPNERRQFREISKIKLPNISKKK